MHNLEIATHRTMLKVIYAKRLDNQIKPIYGLLPFKLYLTPWSWLHKIKKRKLMTFNTTLCIFNKKIWASKVKLPKKIFLRLFQCILHWQYQLPSFSSILTSECLLDFHSKESWIDRFTLNTFGHIQIFIFIVLYHFLRWFNIQFQPFFLLSLPLSH